MEVKKLKAALVLALLACAWTAQADATLAPPALSFVLSPAVTIPLGPGAEYFLPGGAAELAVEYTLPTIPMLSLGADVLYGFTPIAAGLGTTSEFAGLLGAAWRMPIIGRLSGRVFARGGYGMGVVLGDLASALGGGPLLEGGAGLSFTVSPFAVARLDTSYSYMFGANGNLKISVGLSVRPRGNRRGSHRGEAAHYAGNRGGRSAKRVPRASPFPWQSPRGKGPDQEHRARARSPTCA